MPNEDTVLTLSYRFYAQNGAFFYKSFYDVADLQNDLYFTRARELGPLQNDRLSLTLEHSFEITGSGPEVKASGELAGAYYHYSDYVLDRVFALSATVDLTWEL